MKPGAVLAVLDYEIKAGRQRDLFETVIGAGIGALTGGKFNYMELLGAIWNGAPAGSDGAITPKSAEEIISGSVDVFKAIKHREDGA